jgi:3-methyladenine DNA glycosylase AlkD
MSEFNQPVKAEVKRKLSHWEDLNPKTGRRYYFYQATSSYVKLRQATSNWLNGFSNWKTADTKEKAVKDLAKDLQRDIKHLQETRKAVLALLD